MDAYDPTPLVLLCDSIIEDGEISGDELYGLAVWLNDNREACFHWPGNELVGPLQEIWADGKVNKTEMRQMGRILVRIRKEWNRRQREQMEETARSYVDGLCDSFDLSLAAMPPIPYGVRVRSSSEAGLFYDVDLSRQTCSCPDWKTVRRRFPATHMNRSCKHILEAYGQIEPERGWPGWLAPLVGSGFPAHPHTKWVVAYVGDRPVLVSSAPRDWANVFAPEGPTYGRFGYNVIQGRWSYEMEPDGADQIIRAIYLANGR